MYISDKVTCGNEQSLVISVQKNNVRLIEKRGIHFGFIDKKYFMWLAYKNRWR